MAVLEDVPGVEATVQIGARTSQEYDDPNAHEADPGAAGACPVLCTYIECFGDAEFAVRLRVNADYEWGYRDHSLAAYVYIDGHYAEGTLLRPWHVDRTVDCRSAYERHTGLWSKQKFKFAAVETVDEARRDRVQSDTRIAKDLGVIEVQFKRVTEHGSNLADSSHFSARQGNFELAEKALKGKAISHGTSFQDGGAINWPSRVRVHTLAEDRGPIAIIRFYYRSREALKRELIIPRSPSLSPTLLNLSSAERDRLAMERLEDLRERDVKREQKPLIKREIHEVLDLTQDDRPGGSTKRIKREPEVIDLTDD
ncbi:hypothetical protein GGR56DRAFT_22768 [Xylariaceae sp. FL0804]|nr:hypothetical protein GGR56DRAFT_22768 [Xylariaceae sp. FL0804]